MRCKLEKVEDKLPGLNKIIKKFRNILGLYSEGVLPKYK